MLNGNEPIIGDHNYTEYVGEETNGRAMGLIPRNYSAVPFLSIPCTKSFDLKLIPQSEWSERIREMEATKSRLSDLRDTGGPNGNQIRSLDQDGIGYCWAHSSTNAVKLVRVLNNQPYIPLSAFMVASIIKNGRNEGGFGAESLQFIAERGICSEDLWPEQSRDLNLNTEKVRQNAYLHRCEQWYDLGDRNYEQMMTCLLLRIPVVADLNWWGHSVCYMDPVEVSPGQFGVRFWNSWADSWGQQGTGILTGSKMIPDGAVAPIIMTASIQKVRKEEK